MKICAVIPTVGAGGHIFDLADQLNELGYDFLVIDNGMIGAPAEWETLEILDENIHRMWNAGLDWACINRYDLVAVLNDDIELHGDPIAAMAKCWTKNNDCIAACATEGNNGIHKIHRLHGWAFMMSPWTLYRFPETLQWWFGDNDIYTWATLNDGAIYDNQTRTDYITHIDGGSKTGDWKSPEMLEILVQDEIQFQNRWRRVGIPMAIEGGPSTFEAIQP